ncbi:hypothetical protein FOQG_19092 [Fusarium oxysporum f. sp. raphani 54005]|uniref:Uncharacterized protein n=2 Tax=Fusarium oxysporum TaxID=5507 RepID=X0B211_FUSOX|nr:hypothetical protein FOQG_19092 [Fusarium oxysporum f. sp. raphani 54005]EXM14485.1 hypothetical protein FOTG_17116 [Fusarium oxysporum f. sp. vasinfectum 25433]
MSEQLGVLVIVDQLAFVYDLTYRAGKEEEEGRFCGVEQKFPFWVSGDYFGQVVE